MTLYNVFHKRPIKEDVPHLSFPPPTNKFEGRLQRESIGLHRWIEIQM